MFERNGNPASASLEGPLRDTTELAALLRTQAPDTLPSTSYIHQLKEGKEEGEKGKTQDGLSIRQAKWYHAQ